METHLIGEVPVVEGSGKFVAHVDQAALQVPEGDLFAPPFAVSSGGRRLLLSGNNFGIFFRDNYDFYCLLDNSHSPIGTFSRLGGAL